MALADEGHGDAVAGRESLPFGESVEECMPRPSECVGVAALAVARSLLAASHEAAEQSVAQALEAERLRANEQALALRYEICSLRAALAATVDSPAEPPPILMPPASGQGACLRHSAASGADASASWGTDADIDGTTSSSSILEESCRRLTPPGHVCQTGEDESGLLDIHRPSAVPEIWHAARDAGDALCNVNSHTGNGGSAASPTPCQNVSLPGSGCGSPKQVAWTRTRTSDSKSNVSVVSKTDALPDTDAGTERGTAMSRSLSSGTLASSRSRSNLFRDPEFVKSQIRQSVLKPKPVARDFYRETGPWQYIARSHAFELTTLMVIAVNSLWISIDTDYNKEDLLSDADVLFQVVENLFCAFFTLELLVRFKAYQRARLAVRDAWFLFDAFLVTLMVFETWVVPLVMRLRYSPTDSHPGGLAEASVLRLLRLLRLLRTARMARLLRAVPELMIMIKGMASSVRSVVVTLLLLTIIIYVFAITFTQTMRGTQAGEHYFGNVLSSMNSLLGYGIIMEDTPTVLNEVGQESIVFAGMLLLFILLASFTVLNMLVGVLCETVRLVSVAEGEQNRVSYTKEKLEQMLQESGCTCLANDTVSKADVARLLTFPGAALQLQKLGVDALALVDLMDYIFERNRSMQFADFVDAVLELRGSNATTVKDLVDFRRSIRRDIDGIRRSVLEELRSAQARADAEAKANALAGDTMPRLLEEV
eukprot:TRINITY_DN22752_c0_g1_i1.p1 TRINITY_DN22752_c0_g1~~TRINITY_DN22752_c0_g1_i1.p1  ORF type:complete len:726 (+),score=135.39 TRINITY_DN22752_c0_g1_i1:47-2179(+)